MQNLAALSGWQWIKQGCALFRRQPSEMSTLFMLYVSLTGMLSVIPVVGLILRFILAPAFSMAFMQACTDIERGKRVYPTTLFSGFRMPAFKSLAILGIFYLAAALLALTVALTFDGGIFWQALTDQTPPDQKSMEDSGLVVAMLLAMTSYLAMTLPLWFAPPLIAWQKMSVGKAIFFSFFSVLRAYKAFFVYLLAWMGIGMFLMLFVSTILRLLFDNIETEIFILLPFALLIMLLVQCSFYPSYAQVFGAPQLPEEK